MTCIAGLVHEGRVYVGGDSAAVAGNAMTVRADEKVFRNGPFLMGFTTSFRMGQLLRHAFTPPAREQLVDVNRYMVTTFVDAVRACLKAGGYAARSEGAEHGGTFLVGYAGRLFRVCDDYQVAESADEFEAIGCGDDIARGALFATRGEPPDARILTALAAAARFSAGVREPFTVLASDADLLVRRPNA